MDHLRFAFALLSLINLASERAQTNAFEIELYVNKRVQYGKEVSIVVTMSEIPESSLTLRLRSPVCLIGYWIVAPSEEAMEPRFIKTDNIAKELDKQLIIVEKKFEVLDVFFVVLKTTFYMKNNVTLTLTTKPESVVKTALVMVKMPLNAKKKRLKCIPQMRSVFGPSPDSPMPAKIVQAGKQRIEFVDNCGKEQGQLSWLLMDVLQKKVLLDLGKAQYQLVIPPYALRFQPEHELWRNLYSVQIKGKYRGVKYLVRSYLKAEPGSVLAVIGGGSTRNVYVNDAIFMDGSSSQDHSKLHSEKQFHTYNWKCQSKSDRWSWFCIAGAWKNASFRLAPNLLRKKKSYTFSLTVVSEYDPAVTSTATQVVNVMAHRSLDVVIDCVGNCENDEYTPDKVVNLKATCLNCGYGMKKRFMWLVDGQKVGDQETVDIQLQTDSDEVNVVLIVVATYSSRRGHKKKVLKQSRPPRGGQCIILPREGTEALTEFNVCCSNFVLRTADVEFLFYARGDLVRQCTECCLLFLPSSLTRVDVLICNKRYVCTSKTLSVNVHPLTTLTEGMSVNQLLDFAAQPEHNLANWAKNKENHRYRALLQAMISHLTDSEIAVQLLPLLESYDGKNYAGLSLMANMTLTLATQLSPIDGSGHATLLAFLKKLNDNFQKIYDLDWDDFLVDKPFINVTTRCIGVYRMMTFLNKHLPRPPQVLYDKYKEAMKSKNLTTTMVNELHAIIDSYENEQAKHRSKVWLESMWETEMLFRYLYPARQYGIQSDKDIEIQTGISLEVKCMSIAEGLSYTFTTTDQMHEVTISPEILQELKAKDSDEICVKVISTIRELNWWYPEEKQPSRVLLTVHIYHKVDEFKEERHLKHSKINFKTIIGKYRPALGSDINFPDSFNDTFKSPRGVLYIANRYPVRPMLPIIDELDEDDDQETIADTGKYVNCLKNGTLVSTDEVAVYRISLDEKSMVVVRFLNTTHRLRVLLLLNKLPRKLRATIAKSKCTVPALSTNTTMVLRNNCETPQRMYMAVQLCAEDFDGHTENEIPDGPARFSFVLQVRTCDYWLYSLPEDDQHWSHQSCLPDIRNPEKGSMYCTCTVLGTYTSYVFHVPAIFVPVEAHIHLEINWILPIIYLLVAFLLFAIITYLFVKHNKIPGKTIACDMSGLDKSDQDVHDLLVYIRTGGCPNAGTTATVRLIFQTTNRAELQFTLMQDPAKPELTVNSTFILWLRSKDIRLPTRIAVSHNNAGRYPSWFLRRIDLVDLQAQLMQVFHVHRWVLRKHIILSSAVVLRPGDYNMIHLSWLHRFLNELERQWINWGLWQPLCGKWRGKTINDNLTRAERVCIFINKLVITFTVCASIVGQTTPETVYEDRKLSIELKEFLWMIIISIVLTNLAQFLILKLIYLVKK